MEQTIERVIYLLCFGQEMKSFTPYSIIHGQMNFDIKPVQIDINQNDFQIISDDLERLLLGNS